MEFFDDYLLNESLDTFDIVEEGCTRVIGFFFSKESIKAGDYLSKAYNLHLAKKFDQAKIQYKQARSIYVSMKSKANSISQTKLNIVKKDVKKDYVTKKIDKDIEIIDQCINDCTKKKVSKRIIYMGVLLANSQGANNYYQQQQASNMAMQQHTTNMNIHQQANNIAMQQHLNIVNQHNMMNMGMM